MQTFSTPLPASLRDRLPIAGGPDASIDRILAIAADPDCYCDGETDWEMIDISCLVGRTVLRIHRLGDEALAMLLADGAVLRLVHRQDCCERVEIEDICGDLDDLFRTPLRVAEERVDTGEDGYGSSVTWTFYTLRTIRGSVDIRWHGTSNGYYSERVDTEIIRPAEALSAHDRQALAAAAGAADLRSSAASSSADPLPLPRAANAIVRDRAPSISGTLAKGQ